jgi:hypothetical protein
LQKAFERLRHRCPRAGWQDLPIADWWASPGSAISIFFRFMVAERPVRTRNAAGRRSGQAMRGDVCFAARS